MKSPLHVENILQVAEGICYYIQPAWDVPGQEQNTWSLAPEHHLLCMHSSVSRTPSSLLT